MNLMQVIRENDKRRIEIDDFGLYCPVPESRSPYHAGAFPMPNRHDIGFFKDKDFCYMEQSTFNKLLEYSTSTPSGVWVGKMWKCDANGWDRMNEVKDWYLRWYGESPDDSNMCRMFDKKIIIAEK